MLNGLLLGPVHTNADSFESVYFLIRLGLASTLTRGSDPPNPYKFWKRSRKCIKTNPYIFRASVDGQIRRKMEKMTSTVPRGRITGSRAKIKNENKHGGKNMLLFLIRRLFGVSLALFSLLLVSHRRITILMRDIAFSRTSCRRFPRTHG